MEETLILKQEFAAELLKAQIEIQENTLQTMGSDLHDNMGQLLSLINLTLKSAELHKPEKLEQKIESAINLTSRAIQELRLLGKLFQGEQLISQGLQIAIEHELEWINKLDRYQINYNSSLFINASVNPDKELIVFRVFQEIINNVIKHAGATMINVQLHLQDGILMVDVHDNGKGFITDAVSNKNGMGLHNIHKRANIIGGEAFIISKPGFGTHVSIRVPY